MGRAARGAAARGPERVAVSPQPPLGAPEAAPAPAGLGSLLAWTGGWAADAPTGFAPIPVSAGRRARRSVAVLQIGDSHTAADFFTGEVRRELQAKYGDGGVGYLEVGRPHPGVHKSDLTVKADPGWSYSGIQQPSADATQFALSGFFAQTSLAGQSLSFTSETNVPYTGIDIEVRELLLDTHVWLWWTAGSPRMPRLRRPSPGRT